MQSGPVDRWGASLLNYLLVFVGGGIGSMLRHTVNVVCAKCAGPGFPYGTLTVNITGSLVMGLFAGYFAFKGDATQSWRLFLMTGVLGGYTTFSAFSLDAVLLVERGQSGLALVYVLASVMVAILALVGGLTLMRYLT